MSAEPHLVAGRYQLVRRIGSGAMGIVWEARDDRLNRTVAVKQLLLQPGLSRDEAEEARLRTMREGRIAARLHHPNAVGIFDVVDEDGKPCLVMEYLPSRSLDAVMAERTSLAPAEVARIGAQVSSALAAAHAAGIVHRDIKPGNVLLGENGIVKITDFGISRATDDVTVTKTGLIAGTPAYLAPEVAIGKDPTPAADMFSLGSTLYAAVEGQPPFGLSENTLGLLHAVAAGRVQPPTQAGPMTPVLQALLQPEPDDRPTAREALEMLRAVARGETVRAPVVAAAADTRVIGDQTRAVGAATATRAVTAPGELPAEQDQPRRSRRGLAIGGAIAAALVLAAIVFAATYFTGDGGNNGNRQPDQPGRNVAPPPSTSKVLVPPPITTQDTQQVQQEPTQPQQPTTTPSPTPTPTPTTTTEPTTTPSSTSSETTPTASSTTTPPPTSNSAEAGTGGGS